MTWAEGRGGRIVEARLCLGCGEPFIARRWNQTRHAPGCRPERHGGAGKSRARNERRAGPPRFVAIDGEGVTDANGDHRYVLLTCGKDHLSIDGAHLRFLDIAEFLVSCWRHDKEAAYVGFYLSYDWAQWLRTIPRRKALMLFNPAGIPELRIPDRRYRYSSKGDFAHLAGQLIPHLPPHPVDYGDFEFDYLPGKRFMLRRKVLYRPDGTCAQGAKDYMSICDAGPFFQSSFLKAIDPATDPAPVVSEEEFATIARGKARRAAAEFDPEMVEYNSLECEVLSRLMDRHAAGIATAGLKLQRNQWFGPGQVASKWLRSVSAPTGADIREAAPEAVRDAARGGYFGGWFEQFWHGLKPGRSWEYDINSAYPRIMSELPCLLHGHWEHHRETALGRRWRRDELRQLGSLGFCLIYAEAAGNNPVVGAMMHRTARRKVLRPQRTIGWFWAFELEAAYRAGFIDELRVFELHRYVPACDCPCPLAGLADLYQMRLEVGKNTAAGRAYRLIYNSAYGKLTQSIGSPKWSNPIYASAITAGCRTMVTNAIATHPRGVNDLLQVATDGVCFASPHTALDIDPQRLGAWTEKQFENLSLFLPGKYWDDEARKRLAEGKAPIFRSRGIPARDFARHIPTVDRAWARFYRDGWPRLWMPVGFQLVSPKQALARNDWSLCGTVERGKRVLVSSNPADKRVAPGPGRSRPWSETDQLVSTPYDGTFGEELREELARDWGDHPEGPMEQLQAEMMFDR